MQWVRRLYNNNYSALRIASLSISKINWKADKMNSLESILIDFLKKELTSNPQLAGTLLQGLIAQLKSNPTLLNDIISLIEQILPTILGAVKP